MTRAHRNAIKQTIARMSGRTLWKNFQELGEVAQVVASEEMRVHYQFMKTEVMRRLTRGRTRSTRRNTR